MTLKARKPRASSKGAILDAAVRLAKLNGLRRFARIDVATLAEVAEATVSFHFGTMDSLRQHVVDHAIEKEILPILVDVRRDAEYTARLSADLKQRLAAFLTR